MSRGNKRTRYLRADGNLSKAGRKIGNTKIRRSDCAKFKFTGVVREIRTNKLVSKTSQKPNKSP